MATVAIVLKTKQKLLNNEFAVALRVTHNRVRKYYNLSSLVLDQNYSFQCRADQWRAPQVEDDGLGRFLKSLKSYKELNSILEEKLALARKILADYDREDNEFDFNRFQEDIKGLKKKKTSKQLLQSYYSELVKDLESQDRIGLAAVFESTQSSLREFRTNAFIYEINVKFLEAFEAWLRNEKKLKDTSISVKMRNIQRVVNIAIGDKLFKAEDYPFGEKKYSVNKRLNHKTRKRSVPTETIAKVKALTLEPHSSLALAKDIFLFSFYTRGMNFADIVDLKWSDIEGKEIHYKRKKTGQLFDIPINVHSQQILDNYKKAGTDSSNYIFPIYNDSIHKTVKQKYTRKKTAIKKVNDNLKTIAELIGQPTLKLTTYVSRHSYATNLKRSGAATAYISEALGHQTEEQTQTYLDEFEKGVISELERKIFDF